MMVAPARVFESCNLILGSYDGSIAGLSLTQHSSSALQLGLNFGYTPHASAVTSCALSGSTLVTGGYDETIRVYSLSQNVEQGTLLFHNGTINALKFANDGRQMLFSAADDAQICAWRTSDWACLKTLTGHQQPVLALDVHPSCKVMLSSAADRAIFMWDLQRGKIVYSAKTKSKPASDIQWSPCGEKYMLRAGNLTSVSNVDGKAIHVLPHEREVLCATFVDEHRIVTGCDDKMVRLWDSREEARKAKVVYEHDKRVRGVHFHDGLLVSVDGAGGVKVWDERRAEERLETLVADGKLRITCATMAPQNVHVAATVTVMEKDKEEKREEEAQNGDENSGDGSNKERRETASQRKRKKRKKKV